MLAETPQVDERPDADDYELSLVPLARLSKDLRAAAGLLSVHEIRFLVDTYYQMQDNRKASGNQARVQEGAEPNEIVTWAHRANRQIEDTIKGALGVAASKHHMGEWALGVVGIGPVLSAGLLAHIDIEKAPTASHIWRFAGLDPTSVWAKGQKRPWNARLKVLCWKIGESFVKVQRSENGVYGRLFVARKRIEWERNLRGDFAAQATELAGKFKKTTDAYPWYAGRYDVGLLSAAEIAPQMMSVAAPLRHAGLLVECGRDGEGLPMLPPGHINSRAKRWAVKQFLVDWHREAYRDRFGKEPALPYVFEHATGHSDFRIYGTDKYVSIDEARALLGKAAQ